MTTPLLPGMNQTTPEKKPGKGLFIILEGNDGTGKSTQAERLAARLARRGHTVVSVREPGATQLGQHIRSYVKGNGPLTAKAEMLLFQAARAQLMEDTVIPALKRGATVVADRHTASTVAYQGYGKRVSLQMIETLNKYATSGTKPDITLLLQMPAEEAQARSTGPQLAMGEEQNQARVDDANERRFETRGESYHARVHQGYAALAKADKTWQLIDARQPPDEVEEEIWKALRAAGHLSETASQEP